MKDSFGVDVEPGDWIISAPSNKWGRIKIGTVYTAASGRLMVSAEYGAGLDLAKVPVGSQSAVLRKADGTVPAHIGYTNRLVVDGKPRKIVEAEFAEDHGYCDVYDVWVEKESG